MQLLFLFGKSGVGKSYVARVCAEDFGFEAYEGDRDLTPEMKEAIAQHRPFTPDMRSRFATVLAERVTETWTALTESAGLVVSQGLFKEQQRRELEARFPHARWVWVRASDDTLRARLAKRSEHAASASYAELVNVGFEPPLLAHEVLENDLDRASVVRQLGTILMG